MQQQIDEIAIRHLFEIWEHGREYVICRNNAQVEQMLYICGLLGDKRYDNAYQYGRQGYLYFYNDLGSTVCYGSRKRTKEVEFPTFLASVMEELALSSEQPIALSDYILPKEEQCTEL